MQRTQNNAKYPKFVFYHEFLVTMGTQCFAFFVCFECAFQSIKQNSRYSSPQILLQPLNECGCGKRKINVVAKGSDTTSIYISCKRSNIQSISNGFSHVFGLFCYGDAILPSWLRVQS